MRDALASALIERFDTLDVKSIVLMGSHALGDAGLYSDVDLARFISEPGDLKWVRLRRIAFGIAGENEVAPSLREQVTAGLRMYVVTAEMLVGVLRPEDEPLVAEAVRLIKRTLGA